MPAILLAAFAVGAGVLSASHAVAPMVTSRGASESRFRLALTPIATELEAAPPVTEHVPGPDASDASGALDLSATPRVAFSLPLPIADGVGSSADWLGIQGVPRAWPTMARTDSHPRPDSRLTLKTTSPIHGGAFDQPLIRTLPPVRSDTPWAHRIAMTNTPLARGGTAGLLQVFDAEYDGAEYELTGQDTIAFDPRVVEPDESSLFAIERRGLRADPTGGTLAATPGISLDDDSSLAPDHGFTSSRGSFAMYDVGLRLNAARFGSASGAWVGVDFIGGLQAVHASVRSSRDTGVGAGPRDAEGFVAIPVLGTRVSWSPVPGLEFSGRATTEAIDTGSSIIDLAALATLNISESIDLEAGYQDVRGSFNVRGVDARLDESGVFARISIQF